MVHSEQPFAIRYRDKIVGNAISRNPASIHFKQGNRFRAAVIDFSGNLFLSSLPQTLMGLSVVTPYLTTTYQGWVGGIVSIDSNHESRLKSVKPAIYYFVVLLLQFIPYSLAIGSGLRFGVVMFGLNRGAKLSSYKIEKQSLKDIGYIHFLVIPLFFIASCFEYGCYMG